MKRLVVFFPSWRYFGHLTLPLFEPLAEDYEIVFFHTEKAIYGWNDFPDLSEKGIKTIDLHSLKTFSFVKALQHLKADCLIVMDKGWVQDRAILHAATRLRIPTLQIQHGIVAAPENVKTNAYGKRMRREFVKIVRTFRLYHTTVLSLGLSTWIRTLPYQFRLFINPNGYYHNHRTEAIADRACIMGKNDLDYFTKKEGYAPEQLDLVGSIFFEKTYRLSRQSASEGSRNQVLYLSQPLYEDHFLVGGLEAKRRHIQEILDCVRSIPGLKLAIKPHPRENSRVIEEMDEPDLVLYPRDSDLDKVILESRYVIGCCSTTLINALILRKPIGIIRWIDDGWYNIQLDRDGVAFPLRTPASIKAFVEHERAVESVDPEIYACDRDVHREIVRSIEKVILRR